MRRFRRVAVLPLAALPLAALALASCSSSGTSSAPSTSAPAATSAAPTSSAVASTRASSVAPTSSAPAPSSSVAGAPAGAVIKPGSAKRFPATVGSFTQAKTSSGPSTIYSSNGHLASVNFLSGSDYNAIVKNITRKRTKAGTGYCGSTSSPTNLTCYLKAADGVINVSADSTGVTLPQLVSFANGFTAALGTS